MIDFDKIWLPLYIHGSSERRKGECKQLWDSLTEAQQQHLVDVISRKVDAGVFVQYDPYRAIIEHIPRQKQQGTSIKRQPTFLRGDEPGDLVQVKYEGKFKICSREDANMFGLEITDKNWGNRHRKDTDRHAMPG